MGAKGTGFECMNDEEKAAELANLTKRLAAAEADAESAKASHQQLLRHARLPWTTAEERALREAYCPGASPASVATHLASLGHPPRSPDAVGHKAHSLGLTNRRGRSPDAVVAEVHQENERLRSEVARLRSLCRRAGVRP